MFHGHKDLLNKIGKGGRKRKGLQTKVLFLGKEVTELQIVENCAVSAVGRMGESVSVQLLWFYCCLKLLLLAASGDRTVGQAGYLV